MVISFVWDVLTWSPFESICVEHDVQDLPSRLKSMQVSFHFVETDRGTPNASCTELDSGFVEKSL